MLSLISPATNTFLALLQELCLDHTQLLSHVLDLLLIVQPRTHLNLLVQLLRAISQFLDLAIDVLVLEEQKQTVTPSIAFFRWQAMFSGSSNNHAKHIKVCNLQI